MKNQRRKKDRPSLIFGLVMLGSGLVVIGWQSWLLREYYQLDRSAGRVTTATITQNDKIEDGKDVIHYSYPFSYHYIVGHQMYVKNEKFTSSGLYDIKTKISTIPVRYLPANPSISRLVVSSYGLDQDTFTPDSQDGTWIFIYGSYFLALFGIVNVLAGVGKLPQSWLWGSKVEAFGVVTAILLFALALPLTILTGFIASKF